MTEKLKVGNVNAAAKRLFGTGIVIWKRGIMEKEVVLLYSSKSETWHLPKAMVKHDESPVESMLRKIPEMTGLKIKLGTKIDSISSYMYQNDEIIPKVTTYYIAEMIGGNLECKGCEEYDEIQYVKVDDALKKLDFDTIQEKERPILEKALQIM